MVHAVQLSPWAIAITALIVFLLYWALVSYNAETPHKKTRTRTRRPSDTASTTPGTPVPTSGNRKTNSRSRKPS